jgi:hypothetical protein
MRNDPVTVEGAVFVIPMASHDPRSGSPSVRAATSKHWCCLFPQHGPGRNERRIRRPLPPRSGALGRLAGCQSGERDENTISVARFEDVLKLDLVVGPKA